MVQIRFDKLIIDKINSSSGVFSGLNIHYNWSHYSKKNEGFGPLSGDKNVSIGNRSELNNPEPKDNTSSSE